MKRIIRALIPQGVLRRLAFVAMLMCWAIASVYLDYASTGNDLTAPAFTSALGLHLWMYAGLHCLAAGALFMVVYFVECPPPYLVAVLTTPLWLHAVVSAFVRGVVIDALPAVFMFGLLGLSAVILDARNQIIDREHYILTAPIPTRYELVTEIDQIVQSVLESAHDSGNS